MDRRYWDEELETAPWPEVEAWQAVRLVHFLDGLRSRSPFHKDRVDSGARPAGRPRSLELLADLPFTTKDELRRSQDRQTKSATWSRGSAWALR